MKYRPIRILLIYVGLISAMYFFGGHVMADGWDQIDGSRFREFLYSLIFVILPCITVIGSIHFLVSARKHLHVGISVLSFVISGLIPVFLLVRAVDQSDDGEAAMAYIVVILVFALAGSAGLLLSSVIQYIIKIWPNQRTHSIADSAGSE